MDIKELDQLDEKVFELKKQFLGYAKGIERPGMDNLLKWLDESGFYKAPASSRYHLAEEGGLVEHTLNVVDVALKFNESLDRPVDEESLILSCLFHDLGKHQYFGKDFYSKKPLLKSGKEPAQPYERNKDLISVPHEISSVHILSQFIELTEDETWAILQHNGMYSDLKYQLQGKETQLQMLVHWADMWASRVIEG